MTGALLGFLLAVSQDPEFVSPSGRTFYPRPDTAGVVAKAESAVARAPRDVDTLIALGRAQASVWRYRDAVATYTRAIGLAPERAVLYRHRGHRYISLRELAQAVSDMEHAAALDSTSFDIWYHLGLAYYLMGRFDDAAAAYGRTLGVARSADDTVAASDWLWMALGRAGRAATGADVLVPIADSMAVRENLAYQQRLLFYKGRRSEAQLRALMSAGDLERATVGYGLATWRLVRGDTAAARSLWREIVAGTYWPAFGFIAAEADLRRMP